MDKKQEAILVIKLGALGDFIQALGPMAAIRRAHPKAEITLLTTKMFETLGEQCGYFDTIWRDPRPQWYELGKIRRMHGLLNLEAEVTYNYLDEITDPLSIREAIRGHHRIHELPNSWQGGAELFVTDLFLGNAYAVKGEWKTKISGSVLEK